MSATMTMTAAHPPLTPPTLSLSTDRSEQHSCPSCGVVLEAPPALLEAQSRIADLEAQVRLLNQKAAAAVDRWADYEDELTRLRIAASHRTSTPAASPGLAPALPLAPSPSPTRTSFLSGGANRLSQLLSPRGMKSSPNLRTPSPPPDGPASTEDLREALGREQRMRMAAESRLSTTSQEVEELSVSLFEQANEMVATERRARAKLEERVETLEKRDKGKLRRLDRLEGAVGRIERVRSLLGEMNARDESVREAAEQKRASQP
ncbi:ribosomal protein L32 [Colletotrichum abscissum]|uniref:Ribosomal protein L32 n=1 Tax=Colletotrichum abscissum TaxID=1671311 RepID=A0A9P9X0W4_9PEZI|nr:ribosomal protein L32 [Colletotrichum abscissum]KAI3530587.1 ribosomal protein L32 [Colletotrichum abscissum]KAK1505031.1 ribosomal protein L32 [Colletotrichum abscissum]